jgi:LPS-assembly lipoprotein
MKKLVLATLAAASLSACGFHLRGSIPSTSLAKTLFIEGKGRNEAFASDFSQLLSYSGGSIAGKAGDAGAVIRIIQARHERRPITLSRQGRANTFDLTFHLVYDVATPRGEVLLPLQEIEIRRDYFNDQTSPLGQSAEESLMRQEMQKEAAQLLLRRVVYGLSRTAS